jgi:hypothetical protein
VNQSGTSLLHLLYQDTSTQYQISVLIVPCNDNNKKSENHKYQIIVTAWATGAMRSVSANTHDFKGRSQMSKKNELKKFAKIMSVALLSFALMSIALLSFALLTASLNLADRTGRRAFSVVWS